MSRPHDSLGYLLSMPERTLRPAAAGLGGLFYGAALVMLPGWLRRSRLYRAIVAGALRIAYERAGGATGISQQMTSLRSRWQYGGRRVRT